jgi:hypothetical protein
MASKNRPVPAAQRSFIAKSATFPSSSMEIALQSCPPMSMTVLTAGDIQWAPRA